MFYKQYNFPKVPQDLKNELIAVAKNNLNPNSHRLRGVFNTTETNELSYVSSIAEYEAMYGKTGPILLIRIPDHLTNQLAEIYNGIEEFNKGHFLLQVHNGISTFPPHNDLLRTTARIYVLEPGGDNVETSWWEIKNEFKHLPYKHEVSFIDNTRLTKIKSVCLQPDIWYDLVANEIHSVENIETCRISLTVLILTKTP